MMHSMQYLHDSRWKPLLLPDISVTQPWGKLVHKIHESPGTDTITENQTKSEIINKESGVLYFQYKKFVNNTYQENPIIKAIFAIITKQYIRVLIHLPAMWIYHLPSKMHNVVTFTAIVTANKPKNEISLPQYILLTPWDWDPKPDTPKGLNDGLYSLECYS